MAEMSEGAPSVETKSPVVGRVTEKIVNVIKSQMPAEHAKRYYGLWAKMTEPLQGKSKQIAEKVDPVVKVASLGLGGLTTLVEAQVVAAAVVIPVVLGGDKIAKFITKRRETGLLAAEIGNEHVERGKNIFQRIRRSVLESRVGKGVEKTRDSIGRIIDAILNFGRIKRDTGTEPMTPPPGATHK